MEPIIEYQPGAILPFNGRGSTQESSGLSEHWAIASCGLIQYVARLSLSQYLAKRDPLDEGRFV